MQTGHFDAETGAVLFLVLLGLAIAITLLGAFVLIRLGREGGSGRPASIHALQAVVIVLLFVLAFLSTMAPPVALLPALVFLVLGLRLLFRPVSRDGGFVLLLLAIAWGLFMVIQKDTLASGADIRVDLLITLPMMTGLGAIGWRIHAFEP